MYGKIQYSLEKVKIKNKHQKKAKVNLTKENYLHKLKCKL